MTGSVLDTSRFSKGCDAEDALQVYRCRPHVKFRN
jgi:hypothetical protein